MPRIEVMNQLDPTGAAATHREQIYLIERDAGLLCRILGLYAARSLDILHVDYAYAAQMVMKLRVRVADGPAGTNDVPETVRVLVAKVSTLVGVIAAVSHLERVVPNNEDALA
jgi:hypothetical protein